MTPEEIHELRTAVQFIHAQDVHLGRVLALLVEDLIRLSQHTEALATAIQAPAKTPAKEHKA